jgi:hypothetical protein
MTVTSSAIVAAGSARTAGILSAACSGVPTGRIRVGSSGLGLLTFAAAARLLRAAAKTADMFIRVVRPSPLLRVLAAAALLSHIAIAIAFHSGV